MEVVLIVGVPELKCGQISDASRVGAKAWSWVSVPVLKEV